jgi:hypothetical protein
MGGLVATGGGACDRTCVGGCVSLCETGGWGGLCQKHSLPGATGPSRDTHTVRDHLHHTCAAARAWMPG